jgi:hypothetical protein
VELLLRVVLVLALCYCARRTVPIEYLIAIAFITLLNGFGWDTVVQLAGNLPVSRHFWWIEPDAALRWTVVALGARLCARRIWLVPGQLVQPGFKIIATAGVVAASAGLLQTGSLWFSSLRGPHRPAIIALYIFIHLMLQVAMTPWMLDKRREIPTTDNRPLWLMLFYIAAEAGLMIRRA